MISPSIPVWNAQLRRGLYCIITHADISPCNFMTGHEIEPCPDHRAAAAHAAGKDVVIFVLGGPGAGSIIKLIN